MRAQCLLFVVGLEQTTDCKELVNCSSQAETKAYVLCPSSLSERRSKVLKIFKMNSVEILNTQKCPSLQPALSCSQVEIVELIVANESRRLKVFVETGNRALVSLFLRNNIICKTKFNRSNIRNKLDEGSGEIIERLLINNADYTYRNPSGGTLLHLATIRNNAVLVRTLLRIGANVGAKRNNGLMPLQLAVRKKNVEVVNLLLKSGAEVNVRKKNGCTCLLTAAEGDNVRIVKLLLKNGALPDIGNRDGLMPIHVASKNGQIEIVKELLLHGASVNVEISRGLEAGNTPLSFAVVKRHVHVAKLLLEHGADVNIQYSGSTVFGLVVEKRYLALTKEIIKHRPDPNVEGNQKALRQMILDDTIDSSEITKMMLAQGFSVDVDDMRDPELLHKAVCGNHLEVMAQLLSNGADANMQYEGATLLHFAVEFAGKAMVELLLTYGADVNALNSQKLTPIHCAIATHQIDIVEPFLKSNVGIDDNFRCVYYAANDRSTEIAKAFSRRITAPVNEEPQPKDQQCTIPQHLPDPSTVEGSEALRQIVLKHANDSNKVSKLMIEQGFSVSAEDITDPNFLFEAVKHNHLEVVSQLLSKGANPNARFKGTTPLHISVLWADKAMVELLLRYKADVNALNSQNLSSIHVAITTFQSNVVELLLENNADVERYFEYLCYAVEKSRPEVVEVFLQKGADPDHEKSRTLGSPLVAAAARGKAEIVEVLLKHSADVDGRNQFGETALHIVACRGVLHIFRILIGHNADIEAQCACNKTPILKAAEGGLARLVRCLLTLGARIDFNNEPAQLTLRIVAEEGHFEVLETLLNFNFANTGIMSNTKLWKYLEKACSSESVNSRFRTDKQIKKELCLAILLNFSVMASEANLHNDVLEEYPDSYRGEAEFRQDCKAEIQHMKTQYVGNSTIKIYDVLTANEGQLARFMRIRSIRDEVYTGNYLSKYPLYGRVLQSNFQKGMSRKLLLKRIIEAAYVSLKLFSEFPYEVMEQIFDHLSIKDVGWLLDPSVRLKIGELDLSL